MTTFESWVLSYVLNSLWQVPLLFAAGWIAARALRPVGTAAEHRVWVTVLLLEGILPALPALPWQRMLMFLGWGRGVPGAGAGQVTVVMDGGAVSSAFHLPAGVITAILVAYGAVSAYFAAQFLWRLSRIRVIRREAEEFTLDGESAVFWKLCAKRFGVEDASVAVSTRIFSPVTMGFANKLLLLPAGALASLPTADLRTVIAHEFAHMRRNDFARNLIYESVSLPVRYHPLLSLTRERIMETREMVCDQMAAGMDGQSEYARSLLRLASFLISGNTARTPYAIGIFDVNAFERRVMKLREGIRDLRGGRRVILLAACAVFGVATCCGALSMRMNVAAETGGGGHTTKTPAYVNVPPKVMEGNLLKRVIPKYPVEAKKAGIQGKVVLSALIGKDGKISKLTVDSGPKELRKSSLDAVKQWTYKLYLLNGEPVAVKTKINVIYALKK